jgi:hypothetical protein
MITVHDLIQEFPKGKLILVTCRIPILWKKIRKSSSGRNLI